MDKLTKLARRKKHIRKKISGSSDRPRLCIYKGGKTLNAQIVDDASGRTICSMSSGSSKLEGKINTVSKANLKSAESLGIEVGKLAQERGVTAVVFDRSGYQYHGVIKAFAEAARKSGLKF